MSSLEDSSKIFRYHRDQMRVHGTGNPLALGWKNPNEQMIRFEVLAQMADLNGKKVLDAGCGHADLYPFLKERYPQMAHYCGVEQIPELVKEAMRRYQSSPDTSFLPRSFLHGYLPVSDYVFACGSLSYRSSKPGFIFDAIKRLYGACISGLAFNLLKYMPADETLVAYDPENIISHCRTLSNNVVLKEDYDAADFTVFIYK